jgi:hypothetical protein
MVVSDEMLHLVTRRRYSLHSVYESSINKAVTKKPTPIAIGVGLCIILYFDLDEPEHRTTVNGFVSKFFLNSK